MKTSEQILQDQVTALQSQCASQHHSLAEVDAIVQALCERYELTFAGTRAAKIHAIALHLADPAMEPLHDLTLVDYELARSSNDSKEWHQSLRHTKVAFLVDRVELLEAARTPANGEDANYDCAAAQHDT